MGSKGTRVCLTMCAWAVCAAVLGGVFWSYGVLAGFCLFFGGALAGVCWSHHERSIRLAEALQTIRRFETALDTMQLGVTIADPDGVILYINQADAAMHGYAPEELIGKPVRLFSPSSQWSRLSPERLLKLKSWGRHTTNVRKDGSVFPVYLMSDAVLDSRGRCIAVVTTCEDLSKRERLSTATSKDLRAKSMGS